MNRKIDYIIALTHLYGLVHKKKVVEIYNMQNEDKIDEDIIDKLSEENLEELADNFTEIHGEYFVSESIMEIDEFEEQLRQRKGKPYYIPEQEELLKYKEETYYEVTKQYKALLNYATKNLFAGDERKADVLCDDIQGVCQFNFRIQEVFNIFNVRGVNFKNEGQVNEVIQLVMDLANNTRIWENNGHTPNEIFEKYEKPYMRPLPKSIGRNEPCPCGSGKKYKKCCGSNQ